MSERGMMPSGSWLQSWQGALFGLGLLAAPLVWVAVARSEGAPAVPRPREVTPRRSGPSPCPPSAGFTPVTPVTVVSRVYTNPPGASLKLDGRPVANPLQVEYATGEFHPIEASMSGYVSRQWSLGGMRDSCIYMELITPDEEETARKEALAAARLRRERDAERAERAAMLRAKVSTCLGLEDVKELSGEALKAHWAEMRACFAADGSEDLAMQVGNVERHVAYYGPKKRSLLARYSCSDVCPSQGSLEPLMTVDVDECPKEGGVPAFDPAWGVYLGCRPGELATDGHRRSAERRQKLSAPPSSAISRSKNRR
jgi:hypothetical protein